MPLLISVPISSAMTSCRMGKAMTWSLITRSTTSLALILAYENALLQHRHLRLEGAEIK
jgi:hypothetical protein